MSKLGDYRVTVVRKRADGNTSEIYRHYLHDAPRNEVGAEIEWTVEWPLGKSIQWERDCGLTGTVWTLVLETAENESWQECERWDLHEDGRCERCFHGMV